MGLECASDGVNTEKKSEIGTSAEMCQKVPPPKDSPTDTVVPPLLIGNLSEGPPRNKTFYENSKKLHEDSKISDSRTTNSAKQKPPKSNKGNRNTQNQNGAKNVRGNNNSRANSGASVSKVTESLRWEYRIEDDDAEEERLRLYKMNRRKRYLASAQAKGLGWAANYRKNGSPVSEDSGIETQEKDNNRSCSSRSDSRSNFSRSERPQSSLAEYSTIQGLGPSHSINGIGQSHSTMVDC